MIGKSRFCMTVGVALATFWIVAAWAGSQEKPARYSESITTKAGKTLTFDMVLIPQGEYRRGSTPGEAGRKEDEGPPHTVALDSFYLCTTETTQALFLAFYEETVSEKKEFATGASAETVKPAPKADVDAITGPTPVYGDLTMGYSQQHPALGMTWHNAVTFCRWLSQKTGKTYRLPTEAEWEYACRAGTAHARGLTDAAQKVEDVAWFEDNADMEIQVVGQKQANPWGLHDMLGNVCEWVHDFYGEKAYVEAAKTTPAKNPMGPKTGDVHVARGGDYGTAKEDLRCAARIFEEDWWRFGDPQIPKSRWWMPELDIIGFRVARSAE